jgi:cytochrome oxidase Cu insertion factor (SCO1/SenC/PrrC family)
MKNTLFFSYLLLSVSVFVNLNRCTAQDLTPKSKRKSYDYAQLRSTQILDYSFKDQAGKEIRISDFKGKYVLIDLWFTGCGACIAANDALKTVHDSLRNENVVFLSISIDKNKEKWTQSITKNAHPSTLNNWAGEYCPAEGTITLYTGGSGEENEFIKKYVPSGFYPQLLLISPTGTILSANLPRPDPNPQLLIDFIRSFF